MEPSTSSVDVIVAGAGMAGLAGGATTSRRGSTVVVIEKGPSRGADCHFAPPEGGRLVDQRGYYGAAKNLLIGKLA
jgi:flavin-dependent dehydrogenase